MGQEASTLAGAEQVPAASATAAVEPSTPQPADTEGSLDVLLSGPTPRLSARTGDNPGSAPPLLNTVLNPSSGHKSTSPSAIKRASSNSASQTGVIKPKLPPSGRQNGSYPGQRAGDEISPKSVGKNSYPGPSSNLTDRLAAPIHHRRPHTAVALGKHHDQLAETMASLLLHPSQQGRSMEQKLEENKKELVGKLNNFISRTGVK